MLPRGNLKRLSTIAEHQIQIKRSNMNKKQLEQFSHDELKRRGLARIARIIYELWEEDRGDTRILDCFLIPDAWVTVGESIKGNNRREHVVPRLMIYDECLKMFDAGHSVESVTNFIAKFLQVVRISSEEQVFLDKDLGLKTKMPAGWTFEYGDVYARLKAANITFICGNPAIPKPQSVGS